MEPELPLFLSLIVHQVQFVIGSLFVSLDDYLENLILRKSVLHKELNQAHLAWDHFDNLLIGELLFQNFLKQGVLFCLP